MKVKDTRLTRNAAQCRKCQDIIESKNRHDFVWCSGSHIFVDGGLAYFRRGGDLSNLIDLCEYEEYIREETQYERECREDGRSVPWIKAEDYVLG